MTKNKTFAEIKLWHWIVAGVLALPAGYFMAGCTALLNGWTLSIIWSWYAVPLGAPELPSVHVAIAWLIFRSSATPLEDTTGGSVRKRWISSLLRPLMILSLAWLLLFLV